jgi:hypothetical protein
MAYYKECSSSFIPTMQMQEMCVGGLKIQENLLNLRVLTLDIV